MKEESLWLHHVLNEDSPDLGIQNTQDIPMTHRHLAQDFENKNEACQTRGYDKL